LGEAQLLGVASEQAFEARLTPSREGLDSFAGWVNGVRQLEHWSMQVRVASGNGRWVRTGAGKLVRVRGTQ
jgi:hypothetical protein